MSDKSILTGAKKPLSSLGNIPEEIVDIFVTKYKGKDEDEVSSYITTKDNKYYCYCCFDISDKSIDDVARDSLFAYTNGELYRSEEESTLVGVLTNAILNNEIEIIQNGEADVTLYC